MSKDRVGLCARCRHARTVPSRTTVYWMCERSKTDPSFDKYPRLPMIQCRGFEPAAETPDASCEAEPRS
ncbi:MAG: hypothetical protein E6K80_01260 [Candidatus Eisenbacteria bacterium]|uniref:Uncharacterized protein n=1 Tax=Eiseniibacteriota bacterium TaxID=2212470 RepID=A0A538UAW4_UNCEI|nr:MAG: hypothetical protein E6K80_01260 [Candidatus Eisenbacteria bacterium]